MIISNLDHLEVVREDNNIEGGFARAFASGFSSADADGRFLAITSTSLRVFADTSSFFFESAFSSVSGSASSTSS